MVTIVITTTGTIVMTVTTATKTVVNGVMIGVTTAAMDIEIAATTGVIAGSPAICAVTIQSGESGGARLPRGATVELCEAPATNRRRRTW